MLKISRRRFKQLSAGDQGFTMSEVLLAILAAFVFLTGTLQALALQSLIKVRAEREAQATYWIQQDIESVKAIASDVSDDSSSSRCGTTTYSNGFAFKLRDNLFTNKDGGGNALNPSSPKTIPEYTLSATNSGITNPNIQIVSTNIPNDPQFQPLNSLTYGRNLSGKDYRLVRIINPDPNNINILKITYRVGLPRTDTVEKNAANALASTANPTTNINSYDQLQNDVPGTRSIISEQYVEVIPNASFKC